MIGKRQATFLRSNSLNPVGFPMAMMLYMKWNYWL
jgi:hypothetical protein